MSEPENTAAEPQAKRTRGQAKQPRARRDYQGDLKALQQNVLIAVKLLKRKCSLDESVDPTDPIIAAVMDLLT